MQCEGAVGLINEKRALDREGRRDAQEKRLKRLKENKKEQCSEQEKHRKEKKRNMFRNEVQQNERGDQQCIGKERARRHFGHGRARGATRNGSSRSWFAPLRSWTSSPMSS